jgi:NAD(P)-dependent dehydrogenase (short-subunit alcohol dehydrogenase family)
VTSHPAADELPDQSGRTAVVTGANSGLGLAITRALADAGADVVMACRNTAKAEAAAEDVRRGRPKGSVEVQALDLGDLTSVAAAASAVLATRTRVDLLANNAGLMAVDQDRTADGFEVQFGVNHLGHFALTAHLLPALLATPGSRVVTMSSVGHRPGRLDLDDPMAEHRRYHRWGAYFQSKLANLLFTAELQRRLAARDASTIAVAAHPGYTHTDLGAEGSGLLNRLAEPAGAVVGMAPEKGARPFLVAATAAGVPGGSFWGPRWLAWGPPRRETPSRRARDAATAARLWELSEGLTGLRPLA